MRIKLNGNELETNVQTLGELCSNMSFDKELIATAVNGNFIARDDRNKHILKPSDEVEIVSPRQGG